MNTRRGFLRKVLVVLVLVYACDRFLLADGLYIGSNELRHFARGAVATMAIAGIVTLLARRLNR